MTWSHLIPYSVMKYMPPTGLVAYFETSRNDSFKYLVCRNSPMVEATNTKFLHVLH